MAIHPPTYEIGSALDEDLAELARIELRAAAVFPEEDLPPELRDDSHELAFFEEALASGRLWVARCLVPPMPVGFAVTEIVDGSAHLTEMDVLPAHARRGLGRGRVLEVARWAAESGHLALTLTTFRHLPWNAPFYASLGFAEVEKQDQGPELRRILEEEAQDGLDPSKRVAMSLDLRVASLAGLNRV